MKKLIKRLVIVAIVLAIAVAGLWIYQKVTESKKEETPVAEEEKRNEEAKKENEVERKDVEKEEDDNVVYKRNEEELPESPLRIGKAEVEEKLDEYSFLKGEEPILFEPEFPAKWVEAKTQIDMIENYFDMTVEERYEKMLHQEWNEEEREAIEAINELNKKIEEAFKEKDYNKFLRHLYKDWRLDYGVKMIGLIENGRFEENIIEFFPEDIDLENGFAYGFYFKEIIYIEDGKRSSPTMQDGMIVYRQNKNDEWEIYFEFPF